VVFDVLPSDEGVPCKEIVERLRALLKDKSSILHKGQVSKYIVADSLRIVDDSAGGTRDGENETEPEAAPEPEAEADEKGAAIDSRPLTSGSTNTNTNTDRGNVEVGEGLPAAEPPSRPRVFSPRASRSAGGSPVSSNALSSLDGIRPVERKKGKKTCSITISNDENSLGDINPLHSLTDSPGADSKKHHSTIISAMPSALEIRQMEVLSLPDSVSGIDELLQKIDGDWTAVWRISKMMRRAIQHGGKLLGMGPAALETRRRLDMLSGDPHLIRHHAIVAFLKLLSPAWRARLIYAEFSRELMEAKSHGSALRATSYGTELALSAAANSMDHLRKGISRFLVDLTLALSPEQPADPEAAEEERQPRALEVCPTKSEDKKLLESNRKEFLRWSEEMMTAITASGVGSESFEMVINALYAAVVEKFTPTSSPRNSPRPRHGRGTMSHDFSIASPPSSKSKIARASAPPTMMLSPSHHSRSKSHMHRASHNSGSLSPKLLSRSRIKPIGNSNEGGPGSVDIPPPPPRKHIHSGVLRLIGGFLFLRLLNPKLLMPSNLLVPPSREHKYDPQRVLEALEGPNMQKNLKLMVRVLQAISNGKTYSSGSPMAFLNPWLKKAMNKVDSYLTRFCQKPNIEAAASGEGGLDRNVPKMKQESMLTDLRDYLIHLLPAVDYSQTSASINTQIVTHTAKPSRPRPELRSHDVKVNNKLTKKAFRRMSRLLIGLEWLYEELDQSHLLGVQPREFTEKAVYESHSHGVETHAHIPFSKFTFTAHAPRVFLRLQRQFGVSGEQLLYSIATNLPYANIVRNTKKKESAYVYTYDKRFIIKTESKADFKYFLTLLDSYYKHVRENKNSLLARVLGMYEVQVDHKVSHVVIMANVCYGQQLLHCRYDLKGINVRRSTEQERSQRVSLLKDKDFSENGLHLATSGGKVMHQLKNDIRWLTEQRLQGYRLMVGVYVERENESRKKAEEDDDVGEFCHYGLNKDQEVWRLEDSAFEANPQLREQKEYLEETCERLREKLNKISHTKKYHAQTGNSTLTEDTIFHGISSTPVTANGSRRRRVLYIGIIHITREYGVKRKLENFWRKRFMLEGSNHNVAIAPKAYGDRMIRFISQHILW